MTSSEMESHSLAIGNLLDELLVLKWKIIRGNWGEMKQRKVETVTTTFMGDNA